VIGRTGGGGVKNAGAVSVGTGGMMGRGCGERETGVGISTLTVVFGSAGAESSAAGTTAGSSFDAGANTGVGILAAGAGFTGGSATAVPDGPADDSREGDVS